MAFHRIPGTTCLHLGRAWLHGVSRCQNPPKALYSSESITQSDAVEALKKGAPTPVAHASPLAANDTFVQRHVGPKPEDVNLMLSKLGYKNLEEFVSACVPNAIRVDPAAFAAQPHMGKQALSESEALTLAKYYADHNKVATSFLGQGYWNTTVPPVIFRNVLENHGWFSQYTPYQPEIAQGRLESLLNFQTMTKSLTGLDIANASLLDEGTAAAEGAILAFNQLNGKRSVLLVDDKIWAQTLDVLVQRVAPFGMDVRVSSDINADLEAISDNLLGILVQYPDSTGNVRDYSDLAAKTHEKGGFVLAGTDLLALTVLTPPGEWGADIAFGNAARFGVPLGYGGPHAAFFAVKDKLKRRLPGRIVGVSKDARGNIAYRLALQTREQHIRRDKATSNICTAQALLANMSAMYAVYHGPEGLKAIANKVRASAVLVAQQLAQAGWTIQTPQFFGSFVARVPPAQSALALADKAYAANVAVQIVSDSDIGLTFDETHTPNHLSALLTALGVSVSADDVVQLSTTLETPPLPSPRTSPFLEHPVFHEHHSETEILRYMHYLQDKDLSLVHAMIPLGSCTMKLNSTSSMMPLSFPGFANIHPFARTDSALGYHAMMQELAQSLSELTGLPACSLQPNSGAQGEYAGLQVIHKYLKSTGEGHRDICLIPVSAHGTNPASAHMAGFKVIPVKVNDDGTLDLDDLALKCEKHSKNLAAFMITYPSTYGVFEHGVSAAIDLVHSHGGQVYFDGANFNSMMGITNPGAVNADVCHLNLHKTFGIPHGGGGPGMGPICVAGHLAPFLPDHPVSPAGDASSLTRDASAAIGPISAAPFGSASILTISWMFIKMLGGAGLSYSSKIALLNANYIAHRLRDYYRVRFSNENGRCAHEVIIDFAQFDKAGLKVMDFAKRLQDYGIHPPTCSWPLSTAMLIEPTESESLRHLDHLCDALISIHAEASAVLDGIQPKDSNLIKNAPHPVQALLSDWAFPYSREDAVYPLPFLRTVKFWPAVARVDDSYGDRNLMCECPSVEDLAHSD